MSRKNDICGTLTEMGVKAYIWTKKHTGAYGHVSLLFLIVYTKWIWAYNCPNIPFFPFLNTGKTFATFHASGNILEARLVFIISVSCLLILAAAIFTYFAFIPSVPTAFLVFNLVNAK